MEPHVEKLGNGTAPIVSWAGSPAHLAPPPYTAIEEKQTEVTFEDSDSLYSSTSTLSIAERKLRKPKIPDGGWGWVVVFASLIISMIADGISFSFGLLYIEFLYEFGASKSVTSWIGSLFMAVPLLTGPVMSALVDRFGCRKMTIIGGIVSAFGFVLSSYAQSITMMYITFGFIAGLGLGLCYVTAVVSVAYWFDKKRSLAVGLGACGTGIGTFVYAPMTQHFIAEYGWRGTTLLLAGTFLNMCVCGALMREPEWLAVEEQNKAHSTGKRSIKNASSLGSVSGRSVSESDFPGVEEIRKLMKSGEKPEYILQTLATSMDANHTEQPVARDRFRSEVNLPTFVRKSETVPLEVLEQLSSNTRLYNVILENYPTLLSCRSTSDKGLNHITENVISPTARLPVKMSMKLKRAKKHQDPVGHATEVQEPLLSPAADVKVVSNHLPAMKRVDSFIMMKTCGPRHYLKDIKLHRNSVMYRGAMLNIPKYRLRASSCPDIYRNSMITLANDEEEKWYSGIIEVLKDIADFSLFLELHFLILNLSTILLFTWFIVPYFYLAEHLTRHGYTEAEASGVISVIGVTNTIGMIALGWAADQPWMHVSKTYAVSLILCGISCAAMMLFTDNYVCLMISAAFFGLFFSSNYSFTPAMVVDIISLEKFTNAYGLILLSQGIGNLLGPPVAGLIFDLTGSWNQSFWHAGFWIVIAGVLLGIIPYTKDRRICGSKTSSVDDTESV
ncbi:hypothetical protein PPYR_13086 [Photinus pyralis]|uniref:Major facilitator superfamily (MFS) profile domain-containing protein n=1 Tax=Photinus pyralis TaxID=7054 RepID=A0A5N4A808_PHOPY|nr:monocarboxylate transporter 14-like [Photinus pyralis]KAB0793466.1 hypothetical protein PPYR_13086 [Photinus pyralis]